MYKAKRFADKKTGNTKAVIILVSLLLCLLVAGAVTVAYVFMHTDPVENVFSPSFVACEVVETFENGVKSDVKIENTGDTEAYIRAAVVVTWMSEDGSKVTAMQPNKSEDYTIKYNTSDWKQGSDGYWYYTQPVPSATQTDDEDKSFTTVLIEECQLSEGANKPDGFYLSVEVVASAIQSTPADVVGDQWHVTVDNNGTLTPNTNQGG